MLVRTPGRGKKTKSGGSGFFAYVRPEALAPAESGIVEVFNYGRDREGLIPLWVGEGDQAAPAFIHEAIGRSLAAGETFYGPQRGTPALREAIARYMTNVYQAPFSGQGNFGPERFSVTVGGMHALLIAMRLVAGAGDEVLIPSPAWPNFSGALAATGALPVEVPLGLQPMEGGGERWALDIERVAAAVNRHTRAIVVNSPANPTGWTATIAELHALLELARRHGLWIVADEIYGRLVYDGRRAPSFHDVMEENDRVIFVQTMSKNWAMTGLRVGWLEAPAELGAVIESLIQYSTSGVAIPLQRGATVALDTGDHFLALQMRRLRESRDVLANALAATGRVRFALPPATFYLFCSIEGQPDTRALARRLVDEANVGVAPGTAFGAGGAEYLRLCFARSPEQVAEAARRLTAWIGRR